MCFREKANLTCSNGKVSARNLGLIRAFIMILIPIAIEI